MKLNKDNEQILDWLLSLCQIKISPKQRNSILASWSLLQKWRDTRGAAGIKKWKTISDDLLRWIIRGACPDRPFILTRRRVPKNFWWALSIGHQGTWREKVFVITCLSKARMMRAQPSRDVTTIVRTSQWRPLQFLQLCFREWRNGFSLDWGVLADAFKAFKWETSWTSGPQGSPAWKYPLEDFMAVSCSNFRWSLLYLWWRSVRLHNEREREDYKQTFRSSVELCGGWWRVFAKICNPKGYLHSRLAFLSDKAGKTRVVAIGDLWSQSVLRSYHDRMFSVLNRLSLVDGTFDQDKQKSRVRRWSRHGVWMSSVDMSAATDRLPARVICWALVFVRILKPLEAWAWLRVMRQREFQYPYSFHRKRKIPIPRYVEYAVGQPMGLLSSWASFAITHHALVQLAAFTAGFTKKVGKTQLYFINYAILGDDIVIADSSVAERYKQILSILDVGFSVPKSWEGWGVAEFAKVLYSGGLDLSSLPWGLLTLNKIYANIDAILLFWTICQKGMSLTLGQYLDSLPKGMSKHDVYLGLTYPAYPYYYPSSIWDEYSQTYVEVLTQTSRLRSALTQGNEAFAHCIVRGDPYKGRTPATPAYELGTKVFESQGAIRMYDAPYVLVGSGFISWDPEDLSWSIWREINPIEEVEAEKVTQALQKSRRQVKLRGLARVVRLLGHDDFTTALSFSVYKDSLPHRRVMQINTSPNISKQELEKAYRPVPLLEADGKD